RRRRPRDRNLGEVLARIWREGRVKETDRGCWEFLGATNGKGYGVVSVLGRRKQYLHRLVAQEYLADFSLSCCVCHTCDNRACFNPAHLFVGTVDDNQKDMVVKNRSAHGCRSGRAKLNEGDVRSIHRLIAAGVKQKLIARQFGIAESTLSLLKHGINWRRIYLEQ